MTYLMQQKDKPITLDLLSRIFSIINYLQN